MKTFLSFVLKESRHILRDRRTMLILFGMPTVMMLLFGFAIRTDVKNVRTVVVTASMDGLTRRAVAALDASDYFTIVGTAPTGADAERMMRRQQADLAIAFAPRLASHAYDRGAIQILTDAADPNMGQLYASYAQSIVVPVVAAAAQRGRGGTTREVVATTMLYNPQLRSAYNFVPGIMGMLLMLVCALMTSVSIAREKERGTMEVLLVSPVRPIVIILAKAVPYMALAVLILVAILTMSYFVLDVPLAGSVGWIVVVSLVYILLSLSLGLLISTVAESQLVALLVSAVVLLMPVIILSGLIFPVESMPEVLQWASCVVPARWYIAAMRKLMIMGVDVGDVMRELCVLGLMAAAILGLALGKFKTRLQ